MLDGGREVNNQESPSQNEQLSVKANSWFPTFQLFMRTYKSYPVCNSYPEQFNEQKFASYCILWVQTQYWTYLVSTYTDTSVLQVQSNNSTAIYLKPLVLFDVKVPRTITRLGLGPASNKPRPGEFAEKSENFKEDAAESYAAVFRPLPFNYELTNCNEPFVLGSFLFNFVISWTRTDSFN